MKTIKNKKLGGKPYPWNVAKYIKKDPEHMIIPVNRYVYKNNLTVASLSLKAFLGCRNIIPASALSYAKDISG